MRARPWCDRSCRPLRRRIRRIDARDPRLPSQALEGAGGGRAVEAYLPGRRGVADGELVDRPVGDDLAPDEHGDRVAEASDVVEQVGGVEDRRSCSEFVEQAEDLAASGGVEPGRRLVEDQHVRVAHERLGESESLGLTARETPDAPVGAVGQADDLQQGVGLVGDAAELRRETEHAGDREMARVGRALREVPDPTANLERLALDVESENSCRAARGPEQAHQDLHRGRLAGTVRPEEPEHGIDRHLGRDPSEHLGSPERLAQ